MTTKEFIAKSELLKECHTNDTGKDLWLLDLCDLTIILQVFAKLKCKKQREEVANELLNHEIDWNTPIKINTQAFKRLILNSPEPEL